MTAAQKENFDEKLSKYFLPVVSTIALAVITWGINMILTEIREIREAQILQNRYIQENALNIRLIQKDLNYIQLDSLEIKKQLDELKKTIEVN